MDTNQHEFKSMQEEWRKYRDAIYAEGLPARQNIELHQAFFCGALAAINTINEAGKRLSEDEATDRLAKLIREVMEVCAARADTLKARN